MRERFLRASLVLASLASIVIAVSTASAWVEEHLFFRATVVLLACALIGFTCAIHEASALAAQSTKSTESTQSTKSTAPAAR